MGSYYNRPVLFQAAAGLDAIAMNTMGHAVTLLWLGDPEWNVEDLEQTIGKFLTRGVLNLTITGKRAGDSFGVLMDAVSQLQCEFITVLNVLSGLDADEAVQEFLRNAAPGESQIKAWKEYQIVQVGGGDELRGAITSAIGKCIGTRV